MITESRWLNYDLWKKGNENSRNRLLASGDGRKETSTMFKIILKNGPEEVTKEAGDTPIFAMVEWEDMRKSPKYQGQPADLICTWKDEVILQHRFDSKPGDANFVPADFDIMTLFYKAVGDNTEIKRSYV